MTADQDNEIAEAQADRDQWRRVYSETIGLAMVALKQYIRADLRLATARAGARARARDNGAPMPYPTGNTRPEIDGKPGAG